MKATDIWKQTMTKKAALLVGLFIVLVSLIGLWLDGTKDANNQDTDKNKQVAQARTATTDNQASSSDKKPEYSENASSSREAQNTSKKQEDDVSFNDLSVKAESVLVWDVQKNQPIYAHNAGTEQPLASLTKLMTALVATQEYTGNATTTINSRHLDAYGEYGLSKNEVWTLDDLISFMLIESANEAARAVATAGEKSKTDKGYSEQFVEMMNQTATNLNLTDTYFFNPSGLDINEDLISGGYGTAEDIVRLFVYIQQHYPDILQSTTHPSLTLSAKNGSVYKAENTNNLVGDLPKITGSKTGYTVLAGGNLVMGFDLKRPVVIAVLGSTKDGRFSDIKKLYNRTHQYMNNNASSDKDITTSNSVN